MKCEQLFERIDYLKDQYVHVWEHLSMIESPTEHKEGVDAAGKYIADLARELGFFVEVFPQAVAGDVVSVTMNADVDASPVIFSGHIDTVHPVGSFGTPAVRIENGCIYGPGVTDCKGGVVAGLAAMHALRDVGFKERPIKLILQTDEEQNSRTSQKETIKILLKEAYGAIAFLNCESTRENTVVLKRKGIVQFDFTVTGKAIHSSRCSEGISSIAEAAHKIIELEKMKDIDGVTCNCGIIHGGTADNTVPGECYFTADIRFCDNAELKKVRRTVREIANRSFVGGECTVKERPYRPAMEESDINKGLLENINSIYRENGLPSLRARMSLGGSDAAYTTEAGIPTVDSIGVAGDYIHTPYEYGVIDSLPEAAKRIAAIAYCISE